MNESDTGIDTDVQVESAEDEDTQVLTEDKSDDAAAETSSNGAAETSDEPTEEKKKTGWLVPLGVGLAVVLVIAAIAILLLMNQADKGRREGGRGAGPQAQWQFTSFPIGGKKADLPGAQEAAIERLIRRWSDAVYLYPADLRAATSRYFTAAAADAFRASDVGLPGNAREVQTKRRVARIWIDVDGARRAAARVQVVATGKSSSREFRSASESHLWLEREGASWKVIGYEVDQRPLPLHPGKDGGADNKGQDDGAAGNKGKDDGAAGNKGKDDGAAGSKGKDTSKGAEGDGGAEKNAPKGSAGGKS